MTSVTSLNRKEEDIGKKKSQLENKSLSHYINQKKKKKTICESNDKHMEQQRDKREDVKEGIKTIKCGGRE